MGARFRMLAQVRWGDYLVALALVAAISVLIGLVLSVARIANISILYLLAVLAAAIRFGRGPAILASVAAFLTFNWFFVGPVHTLLVARPEEIVDLLVLLLAAFVTGQLAARERARHQEAEARQREAVLLQAIIAAMSEGDLDLGRGLRAATDLLRRDLDLTTVRVALDDRADAPAQTGTGTAAVSALSAGTDQQRAVPLAVHGGQAIGTLLVARAEDAPPFDAQDERLLAAAAAQLGTAIERIRLRREANEAETLRRTDELKTALLSAVSHDLRTPLASIIASAGSLRQQEIAWTSEDREEFALTIEEEAQRLNRIVGNLLDLSRIQGGSLHPDKARHDLTMLVDDVVARLRPHLPAHTFVVEVPDDLPPVLIDWVEIDQVLSNLVENAAKYSPPGTEVRIAARPTAREIEVQVADRGPGIPREALPHLFTPFFRVLGRDRMKGPHGSGLGLAVARGLIEAHGGRLGVQNRRGGGAIFTFTLPLLAPKPGANGTAPHREEPPA